MSSANNPTRDYIKSLIGDLEERLYNLRIYDGKYEIDAYCDDLQSQVILTIESAIKDLNELQEKLLADINSYRYDQTKRLSEVNPKKNAEINQELLALDRDVKDFSQAAGINHLDTSLSRKEAEREADDLNLKIYNLEKRIREQVFGRKFMRLSKNPLFGMDKNLVGKFQIFKRDLASRNSKI